MSRVPASERTRKQIAEVSSGDFDQSALPGAKHLLDWRDRELLAPISPFGTFLVTLKEDIARQAPDPTTRPQSLLHPHIAQTFWRHGRLPVQ